MQAVFAYNMNEEETIISGEKKLTDSIENCFILSLYFFSIFPELKRYRSNKLEDLKNKNNPSFEDLNPNTKFIDNIIINQIEENVFLNRLWKEHHINWTNQTDFIIQIYQEIIKLDEYNQYMNNVNRSYEEDRKLVLDIIEKVFVENQLIHWYFEEKNVHWFDDYNESLLMVYKNIASFKETKNNQCKITPLFKDGEEDVAFYKDLFRKTIMKDAEYQEIIEKKLQNWEAERVIGLDMLLMKMAMCELMEFPTIPVRLLLMNI
jgi:N utilization substance protein B